MKTFVRYCALIVVTAVVTGAIVFTLGGRPSPAQAQPAPGSGSATAPAPGGGSGSGSAAPAPTEGWYKALAKKPIDEDGNFFMPKAVNLQADSTDPMYYAGF